jgi:hypothetical protein
VGGDYYCLLLPAYSPTAGYTTISKVINGGINVALLGQNAALSMKKECMQK